MDAAPDSSPEALGRALGEAAYLADAKTALALFLARRLERPLLVEGPAGVGKTDLARAAAETFGAKLVRLQCYEGLDEGRALFEWDYAKQILYTQLVRDSLGDAVKRAPSPAAAVDALAGVETAFFSEKFLIERPILAALRNPGETVLLIDEVDRADPEFEAFLLEVLGEMQVTIPELGTIRAARKPLVILTTNGTREMTDALRRRCLHAFVDYPAPSRELAILERKIPGIDAILAAQLVAFANAVRGLDLRKAPSISEVIDWARALVVLGASRLGPELATQTLGALVKHEEDRRLVEERREALLAKTAPGALPKPVRSVWSGRSCRADSSVGRAADF